MSVTHLKRAATVAADVDAETTAVVERLLHEIETGGEEAVRRISKELEKPRPDLNALYDIHEQVIEENKPLFREARTEWSKLYGLLDPDQVDVAKRYVEDKLNLLAPK